MEIFAPDEETAEEVARERFRADFDQEVIGTYVEVAS